MMPITPMKLNQLVGLRSGSAMLGLSSQPTERIDFFAGHKIGFHAQVRLPRRHAGSSGAPDPDAASDPRASRPTSQA